MDIKIWIALLVLSAIAGISAILFVEAKKKRKMLGWIGAILLIVSIVVLVASPDFSYSTATNSFTTFAVSGGGNAGGGVGPGTVDVLGCSTTDSQTITLSAVNKYTDVATGGSHRYSIDGAPALTVSDAGIFTAYVGNKINVLWMNETKDSYYSKVGNYEVTCSGPRTFSERLADNGTITTVIHTSSGQVMGDGANNESLANGDVKDIKITISGQFQKEFPYGFDAVIDMNKSIIDDVILSKNDVEYPKGVIPQSDTTKYGSGSLVKAYSLPPLISTEDLEFTATIDVDDTNPPPTASAVNRIFIRLYPKNYFINDKNGGAFEGPTSEDENGVITRGQVSTITISID